MRKRNPETSLTRDVIDALNLLPGFLVWRSQAGAVKSRGGGWVHMAPAGTADVVGLYGPHGVFFGVETKNTHRDACKCETCVAQRAWGETVVARGGKYMRARSVHAVLRALTEVPRGTD